MDDNFGSPETEKIGGDVTVEKTSEEGTVFRLVIPLGSSTDSVPESRADGRPAAPPPLARTKRVQSE